jgi:TetR/AcrR family transcriptional regulator, repressor for neighboring sulfatase
VRPVDATLSNGLLLILSACLPGLSHALDWVHQERRSGMSDTDGPGAPSQRTLGAREATTAAMLDAAEELFAAHGFTAVSVRDIAKQAGVSHALVHRYLGSKDDIYRKVLERNEDVMVAVAAGTDDLMEAVAHMFREGLAHRQYLRLVTHSALHGLPFDATMGRFPATELLIELAGRSTGEAPSCGDVDPRVAIAATVALCLGWVSLEPWLVPAAGLQDEDEVLVLAQLERVVRCLIAGTIPGVCVTDEGRG